MIFTVVAYDGDTYDSISEAMHGDHGAYSICSLDQYTTWREIKLIERTLSKSLMSIDAPTAVKLALTNDKDTVTFPFETLCPEAGVQRERHPMQEAERIHTELTTTEVRLSNEDITMLMNLIPQGNTLNSGVREKLHQGSLAIHKKR